MKEERQTSPLTLTLAPTRRQSLLSQLARALYLPPPWHLLCPRAVSLATLSPAESRGRLLELSHRSSSRSIRIRRWRSRKLSSSAKLSHLRYRNLSSNNPHRVRCRRKLPPRLKKRHRRRSGRLTKPSRTRIEASGRDLTPRSRNRRGWVRTTSPRIGATCLDRPPLSRKTQNLRVLPLLQ